MEERDETRKVDGLLRELSVEKGEVEGLGWGITQAWAGAEGTARESGGALLPGHLFLRDK